MTAVAFLLARDGTLINALRHMMNREPDNCFVTVKKNPLLLVQVCSIFMDSNDEVESFIEFQDLLCVKL